MRDMVKMPLTDLINKIEQLKDEINDREKELAQLEAVLWEIDNTIRIDEE